MRNVLAALVLALASCGEADADTACREACEVHLRKLCMCGYASHCDYDTSGCELDARACDRSAEWCEVIREAMQERTCAEVDAVLLAREWKSRDERASCN